MAEICDKCGNAIKGHWNTFVVRDEEGIICMDCLEEENDNEN